MAVTPNSLVMPQTFVRGVGVITNAMANNYASILTGGADGTKVVSLIGTSTDTVDHQILVTQQVVANFWLAITLVKAGAGHVWNVPSVNMLQLITGLPRDNDGQPFLYLESGASLIARAMVAAAAGTEIKFYAIGANF
jgi:hypothetical protein